MQVSEVNAIVTGAANGIGRACAVALARESASVYAIDVDGDGLRMLQRECNTLVGSVRTCVADLTREEAVVAAIEEAFRWNRNINALVQCAGLLQDGSLAVSRDGWIQKLPAVQWRRVLETNLTASFLTARETVAHLLSVGSRPAIVINVSSLSRGGNAGQSAYAAAKAGLDAATRAWALELAQYGIRVVGIAPGIVDTRMFRDLPEDLRRHLLARLPGGRIGRADEIWQAIRFALECEYFNGRIVEVDGAGSV